MTYRIEYGGDGGWSDETLGDNVGGWDSVDEIREALEGLAADDRSWCGDYRVLDEADGSVVTTLKIER
jgi:hypothetical protein